MVNAFELLSENPEMAASIGATATGAGSFAVYYTWAKLNELDYKRSPTERRREIQQWMKEFDQQQESKRKNWGDLLEEFPANRKTLEELGEMAHTLRHPYQSAKRLGYEMAAFKYDIEVNVDN